MSIAESPTLLSSQDPHSLVGRILDGRYRILSVLGEGGIGQVYLGEHERLGRRVAVKVLHEHFQETVNLRARFEREARALATLSHPNIVTITDYGIDDELPYIVMELVEGRDLMKVLRDGPLPPKRALRIMRQVLRSLAYAHRIGIVHRDLKPANVLLRVFPGQDDHVEVLDFGLAKFVDAEEGAPTLTKTGVVVGTPAYMPPEQASGEVVDARADVYAAGLMLFEMLSGKRPYPISDRTERLRQQLADKPPKLASMAEGASVDPGVDAVIAKALALRPDRRYADGAEMLAAVEALPDDCVRWPGARDTAVTVTVQRVQRSRPMRLALVGLFGVASFGAGYGVAGRSSAEGATTGVVTAGVTQVTVPSAAGAPARAPAAEPAAAPPTTAPSLPTEAADLRPPPFPASLEPLVARVDTGRPLTSSQERTLRRYYRAHADDSGAAVLLARSYFNRDYFADALAWYERAFERDPRVKNHDGALYELLRIARVDRSEAAARTLIGQMYGRAAIPAVDAALTDERGVEDRAALERLRAYLQSL